MRDLTRNHVLLFALLFLALFAVLFFGVVQVHKRNEMKHSSARLAASPSLSRLS